MSTENKIFIYDTSLRDGAQAEGVVFSPVAKIHVAKMLDAFGVDYIEGGYAASNPRTWRSLRRSRRKT